MAQEVFIVRKRQDLPAGGLAVFDLTYPAELHRSLQVQPQRPIPQPFNDTVRVATSGGVISTTDLYRGIAAYLLDNVVSGGELAGTGALTATQANTAAANIITRVSNGQHLVQDDLDELLSAVVANTSLVNSPSTGTVLEVLEILSGRIYTVASGSTISSGGVKSARAGTFLPGYKRVWDDTQFRESMTRGQLSVLLSSSFTYLGTSAQAIVIYRPNGTLLDSNDPTERSTEDVGAPPTAWFALGGAVNDGEVVVIGSRTYEFDTNATYTAGNVQVDVTLDQNPAAAITALVAAINGDSSRDVNALADTANTDDYSTAYLTGLTAGGSLTLSTTVGIYLSSAATVYGVAPNNHDETVLTYAVTANDLILLANAFGSATISIATIASDAEPKLTGLTVTDVANGAQKSPATVTIAFREVNSGFWTVCVTDGGAVLDAGDVITLHLIS